MNASRASEYTIHAKLETEESQSLPIRQLFAALIGVEYTRRAYIRMHEYGVGREGKGREA